MQDFISTFSSSLQFVKGQLYREEEFSLHHDCHDPPHATGMGFLDDISPPRRLAGVARADQWRTTPAQVEFPGCASRRRRSDCWNIGRAKDYLRTDRRDEDCLSKREIHALAALAKAKIAMGCGATPRSEQRRRGAMVPEELASGPKGGLVVKDICCSVADDTPWTDAALMRTQAKTLDQLSKVVVGFLTGARNNGYVSDFSSIDDSFNLLPQKNPLKGRPIKVALKDLKAVFFVWEFTGKPESHESPHSGVPGDAKTIEVTFTDGERIVGSPEEYNSQRIGFFMFPVDPKGNNIRIFVVTRNTRQVRLI